MRLPTNAADAAIKTTRLQTLRKWEPRTRLGAAVMAGKIISYEAALASGLPIREVEIVDALIPNLEDEVISVNMVQRMTDSGRRVRFNVMACVGNRDGYVGLGMAKAKEVATAIRKAITAAKLNLIQVQRGNGSWESSPGPGNTVPFKVNGRAASTRVTLMPAARGRVWSSVKRVSACWNSQVSRTSCPEPRVKHEQPSITLEQPSTL